MRTYRPRAQFTDMIEGYTADAAATEEWDGKLRIKRDLADTRWTCSIMFYAEGDFSFKGGRVGFDAPPGATFKETTVPAMIDANPNPVLKGYVLGQDPEADALKILESYSDIAAPYSEWFDGRESLRNSHLPLVGRNVRVYDVPANSTLISVKGPRWTPIAYGSRCYFALDPPLQFYGDVSAIPSNEGTPINRTSSTTTEWDKAPKDTDFDWSVMSSSVGFGRRPAYGIDAGDIFQPIVNYTSPGRSPITVGEHEHENVKGPTTRGVRLFFARLDPATKYTLTIGAQDSICVFESLELVQQTSLGNTTGWYQSDNSSGPSDGDSNSSGGLSGGAIAGIVVGSIVGVALLLLFGFCCWRRRKLKSKAEDFEIADVSTHESKPLSHMGAPTPIMSQSEFPDRHTESQTSDDSRFATTLGTGTNTGTLGTLGTGTNSTSSNTMGQHATMPPTVVRHEEDAGSLEAELPAGTHGGEVVLPPVYRDEWVDRRAGRGLGIRTDVHRSPNELTAEEIKYLGPPTPGATLATMSPSPISPGSSSANTFGHWMNQPLSPGVQTTPPRPPVNTSPTDKTSLQLLTAISEPSSQSVSPTTASPTSPLATSPLSSHPTGSIPETNPLVTPFPPDVQPSETTPNGFPKDMKQ